MVTLLDPIQVGRIKASNRIWMSPCTRSRATRDHVPTPIMAEYYAQRAHAGIIISEAVGISQEGLGWPFAPGIWSQEQVEAWKPITKAVHERGGKIVAQLWHMGRAVHSNVTGLQPVSSSATSYPTKIHTYAGKLEPEVARPLSISEIHRIVSEYGVAANNAIEAGFDGVQIHAANGYLIEQFLKDNANLRTDEYGGSIENRLRLLEEVTAEVVKAIGSDRTAIRLSPNGDTQGVHDSDSKTLATATAEALNKYKLAFLELREIGPQDTFGSSVDPKQHEVFNKFYQGVLVLNQEFDREKAQNAVGSGIASAIAFGRPFMANPDLVEKIAHKDDDWTKPDVRTWYVPGPHGYIDYPIKYKL